MCHEAVLVGTAGPKGLEQHKGKKKCLANIEKSKKGEKESKTLTLFSFLQRPDKETAPTTTETLQKEGKQKLAAASLILVGPSTHPPQNDDVAETNRVVRGSSDENQLIDDKLTDRQGKEKRTGCQHAWLLLDRLRTAIQEIPQSTPEGRATDELAGFNRYTALTVCATVAQDELWENVNPAMDRMLGFGRSSAEIQGLIRRGPFGVQSLCEYLELLVEEGGVVGGLVEGKVSALISAIDK